jgi:hypothetical protein
MNVTPTFLIFLISGWALGAAGAVVLPLSNLARDSLSTTGVCSVVGALVGLIACRVFSPDDIPGGGSTIGKTILGYFSHDGKGEDRHKDPQGPIPG